MIAVIRNLVQRLRRRFCSHVCMLQSLRRVDSEKVEATCMRCGEVLRGRYGLALNCEWRITLDTKHKEI